MLGVFFNGAPDCIDKGLRLAQASIKESLKFVLNDADICLILYLALVLLPAEPGDILWEGCHKRNSVQRRDTGDSEVVFALLIKIITLYIALTPIQVREPCFQRSLTWAFIIRSGGNDGSWNRCKSRRRKRFGFKDIFDNPLEVILLLPNYRGVGGARSIKRSNDRCNSGSRSTCCGGSRHIMVANLGGSSTSELVFAIKKRI